MSTINAAGRGISARLSGGHLLMLAAGLLGAVSTFAALRAAEHTTEVVVARRDLRAGARVERGDLTTARVGGDGGLVARFVSAADRDTLVGMVLVMGVDAGTPVLDQYVREPAAAGDQRAMSFAVSADRAVAGAIEVGDRVDVLAVDRDGVVGYALADALVLDRDDGSSGGPIRSTGSDDLTLTVAVDSAGARRLAAAIADGEVTVVRSTGARPLSDVVWYEPASPNGEASDA